jgi:hypothetical protein
MRIDRWEKRLEELGLENIGRKIVECLVVR